MVKNNTIEIDYSTFKFKRFQGIFFPNSANNILLTRLQITILFRYSTIKNIAKFYEFIDYLYNVSKTCH